VYAAAQHAVAGFRNLKEGPRAFIVTGNLLPFVPPMTPFFALNIQKRIAAAVVEQGATSYEKDGFRCASRALDTPKQAIEFMSQVLLRPRGVADWWPGLPTKR
jgi:hypothetical protein